MVESHSALDWSLSANSLRYFNSCSLCLVFSRKAGTERDDSHAHAMRAWYANAPSDCLHKFRRVMSENRSETKPQSKSSRSSSPASIYVSAEGNSCRRAARTGEGAAQALSGMQNTAQARQNSIEQLKVKPTCLSLHAICACTYFVCTYGVEHGTL